MENRPMTYISQKDIFQFLSLQTRRKLASQHCQFRKFHEKRPFSLKTLCFEYEDDAVGWWFYHKITLDGLTWEIRRKEDSDDLKTVTLPSGKKVDVKSEKKICDELVPRFMTYYLGRKGTRIQKFHVQDYKFPIFNIPPMIVQELHLDCLEYVIDPNLLTYLTSSHFEKMVLYEVDYLDELWNDLREHKITTNFLMLKAENVSGTMLETHGIAQNAHYFDPHGSHESVVENLKMFVEDSEEKKPIGMVYRGSIRIYNVWDNVDEENWMELVKNKFGAKYKYCEERNGICLEMFGDRELFVCARKNNLNNWEEEGQQNMTFRAEILKKGTTLFYHELPAALQEKYQALDVEHTRLQVEADNRRRAKAERQQARAQRKQEREFERAERRNKTMFKVKRWLRENIMRCLPYVTTSTVIIAFLFSCSFRDNLSWAMVPPIVWLFFSLGFLQLCIYFENTNEDDDEDDDEDEDDD